MSLDLELLKQYRVLAVTTTDAIIRVRVELERPGALDRVWPCSNHDTHIVSSTRCCSSQPCPPSLLSAGIGENMQDCDELAVDSSSGPDKRRTRSPPAGPLLPAAWLAAGERLVLRPPGERMRRERARRGHY